MHRLVYADITNQQLRTSLGGASLTLPKLPSKSTLRLALRFSEQVDGTHVTRYPGVVELRATIGPVDLRPEAGTIALKIGSGSAVLNTNLTAPLTYPFTAAELSTALNACSVVGTAVVSDDDDTYVITGISDAITVYTNTLRPITFGRIETYEVNGATTQALRLQRAPYAFTDSFTQRVPDGPVITRVQAGGENDGVMWNEIQKLTTPREFAGSYVIRANDEIARTGLLGVGDGPEQVAAAMNPTSSTALGVALDADGLFIVTEHPTEPAMYIEFSGSMEGAAQDLLLASVFDAPEGDCYIDLDLNRATTSEAFRDADEVVAVLEIFADLEDEVDSEITRENVPIYRGTVTLVESITHADLALPQDFDFINPPQQKTYVPVSPDSLTSGTRFEPFLIPGDGVETEFQITHDLNSPRVRIHLRENTAGGRDLVPGTDYEVVHDDDDAVTITFLGDYATTPPALNAISGTAQDLTATSTWLGHSHTIAEVTGLQTILDTYGAAIAALQALAPSSVALTRTTSTVPASRALGTVWTVPFASKNPPKPSSLLDWTISAKELGEKPRSLLRLLPAVHDASTEALPAAPLPAPAASYQGRVFTTSVARPDFPDGGLLAGDTGSCDGRKWYRVARIGSESTYYPVGFETLLFEVAVNSSELILGSRLDLDFGIELMVCMLEAKARSRRSACSWSLIVEAGSHTADSTPGTPGSNLAVGFSSPVTLLEQRIVLTEIPGYHTFGVSVSRATGGTLTAVKRLYGEESTTTAPASANLALRARLFRFDTENAPTDARGIVAVRGLDVGLDGQPDQTLGKLTIAK